jgi:hypothetical protein
MVYATICTLACFAMCLATAGQARIWINEFHVVELHLHVGDLPAAHCGVAAYHDGTLVDSAATDEGGYAMLVVPAGTTEWLCTIAVVQ